MTIYECMNISLLNIIILFSFGNVASLHENFATNLPIAWKFAFFLALLGALVFFFSFPVKISFLGSYSYWKKYYLGLGYFKLNMMDDAHVTKT